MREKLDRRIVADQVRHVVASRVGSWRGRTLIIIMIAYEASYQRESTGEPRPAGESLNPHRGRDRRHPYLTTPPYIDSDRIGGMGVRAGAGLHAECGDQRSAHQGDRHGGYCIPDVWYYSHAYSRSAFGGALCLIGAGASW